MGCAPERLVYKSLPVVVSAVSGMVVQGICKSPNTSVRFGGGTGGESP